MKLDIPTARVFAPLLAPRRYKVARGGRGSGKSQHFAGAVVEECVAVEGTRVVCVREVQKSLKESAKKLIEDKIREHGVSHLFKINDNEIKTPGGGLIMFHGLQDHTAESIKSLEGCRIAWCEEAQTMSARSLEMLTPTIRLPDSELWFSYNPRHATDPVDRMVREALAANDPDMAAVKANYYDNPWFPDVLELERLRDKRSKPARYGHIWLGEYEPAAVGAIWTPQMFADHRLQKPPESMGRIVVAVDPAISSEEGSDEHGITVGGIDAATKEPHGYLLDDLTCKGGPEKWARTAIAAYDKWDADAIVVERNQGGDMVANTLRTIRRNIRIIEVIATKGKHVRAEPIAALYALGRIHHVGSFPELEQQMCQMTAAGFEGNGSPDRVDATVYAFTELFPRLISRKVDQGTVVPDHSFNVL